MRDIRRGDRPVQRVVLAYPPRDLDVELRQPLRECLGLRPLLGVADFGDLLLALDLPFVGFGDRERQLARQQVVARVSLRRP